MKIKKFIKVVKKLKKKGKIKGEILGVIVRKKEIEFKIQYGIITKKVSYKRK